MKKFLTLMTLICMMLCLGLGLSGCREKPSEDDQPTHVHTLELQQHKSATCNEDGLKTHFKCAECSELFEDPTGFIQVTVDMLKIPAAHTYVDGICQSCGERDHVCVYGEWEEGRPATCIQMGVKGYYCCKICGTAYDENDEIITDFNIPVDNKAHNVGMWQEEIPANCVYAGTKGHYQCRSCYKYIDKDLTVIEDLTLPSDVTKHAYSWQEGSAATCEEDGLIGVYYCEQCHKCFDVNKNIYTGDVTLPATGHKWKNGSCATCKTSYYSAGLEYSYNWKFKTWTVTIGECSDKDVVIPKTREGYPVTVIGNNFSSGAKDVTSVTLPDTINYIGEKAFESCTSLVKVTGSANVTGVGKAAFYGCSRLVTIVSLKNAEIIYPEAFYQCVSLEKVQFGSALTRLGSYCFYGCENLTSIEFENGLETIEWHAFEKCSKLSKIELPETLQTIQDSVFRDCVSLKSVKIPDGLEDLDDAVFYNCSTLESVYIPKVIKDIATATFFNCYSLSAVTFAEDSQLSTIGDRAFEDCAQLKGISLPNGLKKIGLYAFSKSGLTEITIPDSVFDLGDQTNVMTTGYVFSECAKLTDVTIGKGVTEIAPNTFGVCAALTNVTLGENVKSIRGDAFIACSSLKNIIIGNAISFIDEDAFINCNLKNVNYNKKGGGLYWGNTQNPYAVLVDVENGSSITEFAVPENTKCIYKGAFHGADLLEKITLGGKVAHVGVDAFYGLENLKNVYYKGSLTSWLQIRWQEAESNPLSNGADLYINDVILQNVVIPDEVAKINEYAFYNCQSIKKVTTHDGLIEGIGEQAFRFCRNLQQLSLPNTLPMDSSLNLEGTALTEVVVPEGVRTLYLNGCANLQTLTIASTVTIIDFKCLYGCTALKTIYYNGTKAEWREVVKLSQELDNNWNGSILANCVICSDGTSYL